MTCAGAHDTSGHYQVSILLPPCDYNSNVGPSPTLTWVDPYAIMWHNCAIVALQGAVMSGWGLRKIIARSCVWHGNYHRAISSIESTTQPIRWQFTFPFGLDIRSPTDNHRKLIWPDLVENHSHEGRTTSFLRHPWAPPYVTWPCRK